MKRSETFTSRSRMEAVQAPIVAVIGDLIREVPGTISLGQGVVHYGPPAAALDVARDALKDRKGLLETCFFLAGPPGVVDFGMQLLCGTWGVRPRSVRFDRFH